MKLPHLAIENHQFTLVMILLLVIAGAVSFFTMPRSEDPQVEPAATSIIVIYPGTSPVDLEELIIDPVEKAIDELEDIKEINSLAEDGLAVIGVEFLPGSDPDDKFSDVTQKVNSIRHLLPQNIHSLDLLKWTISDVSIMQIALVSDTARYRELQAEAERLQRIIERVPGVKNAELHAIPKQQIQISIDLEKMAHWNLSLERISASIQDANSNIPGGRLDIGAKRLNIKTSGSYKSLDDIRYTVLHSIDGRLVYLKDIAEVRYGIEDNDYFSRVNGQRAVMLSVHQKKNTNIFRIVKDLKPRIEKFEGELARSIDLEIVFDQSESVAKRLNGFFINLLQGVLLVGVIIFAAVGWRAASIVMMVIPISIFIAVGFVDLSHFGLEQMSIAGLVIALGLLVDNAIVVTENISRFLNKNLSPSDAASQATSQVGWAIVSATATTVLAFIPIIMMRDITGDFIRSMPVTVVYTLSASLLISLTLTPYLSAKFLRTDRNTEYLPSQKRLNRFIETYYRSILDRAMIKPKKTLFIALICFLASIALFPFLGVSFFPKAEKSIFFVNINLPKGSSLEKTDNVTRDVESFLRDIPEVKYIVANVGHGNPRIYYNMIPLRTRSTHAQIYVKQKKFDREISDRAIQAIRDKFADYPGAKIEVKELEQGPPIEAPIAIKIQGDDLADLKKISLDVEDMLHTEPGVINIVNPMRTTKSDIRVSVNRDKAHILGVPLSGIDRTIRASMAGLTVSRFRETDGKEYDIVVRLPVNVFPSMDDLNRIYVSSIAGAMVPLKNLAALELSPSPLQINHFNLERTVTVTGDVQGGFSTDTATRNIIARLEAYNWPKGYTYYIGGELESREESFGGMFKAIIVAMIAIFGVLVLQFRSFSQPLIVFSAIPLALIGSILGLFISRNTFSFSAFIGLTSLVGIVVNNSIILVDYTNKLRQIGKDLLSAVKEAGETRFTPIILTTLTTIGGLLPLTLSGGSMWAPMGWTIIGGLLISTVLTLIIVPVLYRLFTPSGEPL